MTPQLAMALKNSQNAKRSRERAAAAGKCPTCRDPIPGLAPVEVRPRPWEYCDACREYDRERKVAAVDVARKRQYAPRRAA